jgi:hypothetical protein
MRPAHLATAAAVALACAGCGEGADGDDPTGTDVATDTLVGSDDDTERGGDTDPGERLLPPPALPMSGGPHGWTVRRLAEVEFDCLVVEDLDGDGHVDVATVGRVTEGVKVHAWYGTATPRTFEHVVTVLDDAPGVRLACAARELDGDGDLDLLYGTTGGVAALLAEGRSFVSGGLVAEIPRSAPHPDGDVPWLATIDLDGRGAVDLVVAVAGVIGSQGECEIDILPGSAEQQPDGMISGSLHCFLATEAGRFELAPESVCPEPMLPTPAYASEAVFVADVDDDGDADLITGQDFGKNRVFLKGPSGLTLADRTGLEVYNHAMGLAYDDFDADGLRDVYITDVDGDDLNLAQPGLGWADASLIFETPTLTRGDVNWGVHALDVDANGTMDLVVSSSVHADDGLHGSTCDISDGRFDTPPLTILLNVDGTRFEEVSVPIVDDPTGGGRWYPSVLARGDLDGDRDDDVVLSVAGRTVIVYDDEPRVGGVLRVRVLGPDGLPEVGASITVRVHEGRRRWDLWPTGGWNGQSELATTFAFGASDGPATVDVRWPDGRTSTYGPFEADRTITIRDGQEPITTR